MVGCRRAAKNQRMGGAEGPRPSATFLLFRPAPALAPAGEMGDTSNGPPEGPGNAAETVE